MTLCTGTFQRFSTLIEDSFRAAQKRHSKSFAQSSFSSSKSFFLRYLFIAEGKLSFDYFRRLVNAIRHLFSRAVTNLDSVAQQRHNLGNVDNSELFTSGLLNQSWPACSRNKNRPFPRNPESIKCHTANVHEHWSTEQKVRNAPHDRKQIREYVGRRSRNASTRRIKRKARAASKCALDNDKFMLRNLN